jgi:hypothetical protein
MKPILNFSLSGILALSSIALLPAQTEEESFRSLQFWALSWQNSIDELKYLPGVEDAPASFSANRRFPTGPHRYVGPDEIVFFETEIDAEGLEQRIPLAAHTFAQNSNRFLLIFNEIAEPRNGGPRYNILGVTYDERNFPPGSYRFINTTAGSIAIQLGEVRRLLPPGAEEILQPEVGNRERFFARMASNLNAESDWELIFSSQWTHRETRRSLIFFVVNGEGRVETKAILL